MARLSVALLGPLHVTVRGQPAEGFGYDKVRALLAYLLLEGQRPLGRDVLAALLWPEALPSTARKSLRTALAALRQAIGEANAQPPLLRVERDTIQRDPQADVVVDVAELRAHLAAVERHAHASGLVCGECAERLAAAAALYRGPFLQQVDVADSVAWEEWALLTRERLHGQVLDTLAQLMAYHEAAGQDDPARQYAWRALGLESWDETAHRCLMRVYARGGQRGAALAQYDRCRKVLADELGIAPAAETTALYEQIRSGPLERTAGAHVMTTRQYAPALSPRVADPKPAFYVQSPTLPIPPAPLIGRAGAVREAAARLRQPNVRLLTLIGPPGVGKTRLGLAVAEALHDDFADGVHFVALAPVRDSALVASAIAHVLGVKESGDQLPTTSLRAFLRDKSLLLLLDNLEHVLDMATLLADLLSWCARLKLLVTSRAALHLRAEHLCPIVPLALTDPAQRLDVEAAGQVAAVALFVDRARAVLPDFALSDGNLASITAICARLDGLPLAIELAAVRSRALPPKQLLAQLDHRLEALNDGPRDLPGHLQTLRGAIAWSYDLLDQAEQQLFRRLGVFVGGCTHEAVAAVCQDDPAQPGAGDAEPRHATSGHALMALCDQHLLQRQAGPGNASRFTMLGTIHEYAIECLAKSGEQELLSSRHASYYLALAEASLPALHGPQALAWLTRLEQEHGNLRGALDWCSQADDRAALGLQLAGALWVFWQLANYFDEGHRWIERFLQLAQQSGAATASARARALCGAGWLAYYRDDYVAGAAHAAESLLLFEHVQDAGGQAIALNLLGFCEAAHGNYPSAIARLQISVALSRTSGDPYLLGLALLNLGFLHNDQGDIAQAQPLLEESLACGRSIAHPFLVARALNALGELARMRNAYRQAHGYYEQSLALYQEMLDRRGMATLHHNLGAVAQYQGQSEQARRHFDQSLAHYHELGDIAGTAAALAGLAGVAGAQGQWERAAQLFGTARALRDASGAPIIPPDLYDYQRNLAAVDAQLDQATFASAWMAGRAMPLEQAIGEALSLARGPLPPWRERGRRGNSLVEPG